MLTGLSILDELPSPIDLPIGVSKYSEVVAGIISPLGVFLYDPRAYSLRHVSISKELLVAQITAKGSSLPNSVTSITTSL